MPDNQIAEFAVILRLDIARSENSRVIPTPIDGFDSIVFRSVDLSRSPTIGMTIDLRDIEHLGIGNPEFVTLDVPVSMISVKPVYISEADREQFSVNTEDTIVQERLLLYYQNIERGTYER